MSLTFTFRRMVLSSVRPIERLMAHALYRTELDLVDRSSTTDDSNETGPLINSLDGRPSNIESAYLAQRRFASRVAHELRTPLTILKGETQVTLARQRTTTEYEAQLRSTLEEVAKMERTIDDLLLFARYESGEAEMPFRQLRLDTVVANVAKDLRPLSENRRIKFEIDTGYDVVVLGDDQALSRLVCKLMENALQYTPAGGQVTVSAFDDHDQTVLRVKDTGVGIPSEEIPQIFEWFYRSERSRNMHPNGTGIGLSFVSVIARLHNANIKVTSLLGQGTEFIVTFRSSSRASATRPFSLGRF